MTKRKNMTAGQRQMAVEKQIEQLTMATRVFQQLLQQTGQNVSNMQRDVSELANRQRELQYRFLAYQELSSVAIEDVNKKAEELQIKDFNDFSEKDDKEHNLIEANEITEDSVVIFTTKADNNKGYLRSKQALSELAFPKMREDLLGKKVGESIDVDINGVNHNLTVLGIRIQKVEEVKDEQQEDGQPLSAQA
jgi:hypothetical protein